MRKSLIMTLVGGSIIAGCGTVPETEGGGRPTGQLKVAITISGPCEVGLDYAGRCDGDVLVWCEDAQQHSADCAEQGESCGWESEEIGSNCIPGAEGSGCGDVDYAGYCDGEVLVWCEDEQLTSVDCSETNRSCGFQNADIGFNCLSSGSSSSGGSGLLTVSEILAGYPYSVTQAYGYTDFDGGYDYCHSYGNWGDALVHCGVDLGVPRGTPLRMPGEGVVTVAGGTPWYQDLHNWEAGDLRVELSDGAVVVFGHSSEIYYGVGASPASGTLIGASGTQNGDHLHLEVRVPDASCSSGYCTVDPMTFFGW